MTLRRSGQSKLWRMAAVLCLSYLSLSYLGQPVRAQDGATLDDVKKMYQDALAQRKAAQDRISELSGENEKLAAKVAEMEKQLATARHEAAGVAEKTYFVRSRYAAWETFMKQYPELLERWKAWLQDGASLRPGTMPAVTDDAEWPFGGKAEG